jgi:hypothetical protein
MKPVIGPNRLRDQRIAGRQPKPDILVPKGEGLEWPEWAAKRRNQRPCQSLRGPGLHAHPGFSPWPPEGRGPLRVEFYLGQTPEARQLEVNAALG